MTDAETAAAAAAATTAAAETAATAAATADATTSAAGASSGTATETAAPVVAAGLMDEEVVETEETKAAAAAAALAETEAARVAEEARRAALTDDERKAEDDAAAAKKAEEDKAKGEPIVYADFTLPKDVTVDAALLDKAKATFSAQKLSQDQAQAMIDLYAGDVGKMIADAAAKPYEAWRETQAEWTAAAIADPEYGGDKLEKSKASVAKAIDTFLSKEEAAKFRAAMKFTGATNNPDVFRFFVRAGQKISEGKFVQGNGPAAVPKTAGEVFFDHPTSAATPAA